LSKFILVFQEILFWFSKNQEISNDFIRNIFEAIKKSFLTTYENETSTQMLVIVHIFIKKTIKIKFEKFFTWASFKRRPSPLQRNAKNRSGEHVMKTYDEDIYDNTFK
jgi:hypothetical protein